MATATTEPSPGPVPGRVFENFVKSLAISEVYGRMNLIEQKDRFRNEQGTKKQIGRIPDR